MNKDNKSIKELQKDISFWSNTAQNHLKNLQLAQAKIASLEQSKSSKETQIITCSNCKQAIPEAEISQPSKSQLESELHYWEQEVGLEQYLANCKQGYLNIVKELKEKIKE